MLRQRIATSIKSVRPKNLRNTFVANRRYALSIAQLEKTLKKSSDLAVVVHLYYTDNWDLFSHKLRTLEHVPFDLFITLPTHLAPFIETIHEDFPLAYIVFVPNRGRDVLPFVRVAQTLLRHNYKNVLKFHSKKSKHWDGGQDWLESTLERLLPNNETTMKSIQEKLSYPNTGVIGPDRYYYPLTINFPANGPHITRVITKLFDKNTERRVLQVQRSEYGFFGGTMFWARLDALQPIIDQASIGDFEIEAGQIDATYAHALERLFCIVPEINHKTMYSLSKDGIHVRHYKSDNIPEWSTDHNK